jgi:regulator of cell morphogenesis and NO signaling
MGAETHIDPSAGIGALVAERPARAALFERLRLEYCCGGRQTLAEACAKRGLDLDTVRAALAALDADDGATPDVERTDWRRVGIAELCAHIVGVHHDGLREVFPRLERLLATVVRVHGDADTRVREAQRLFRDIRDELEPHLASEERELFPACVAWERAGAPIDERMLAEHEQEHAALGDALAALRIVCDDYERESALCATHRALLGALEAFEQDLHRHVHEENNILLPRIRTGHPCEDAVTAPLAVRPRATAAANDSSDALLPCCEAWIAEQTHRWMKRRR